jgi:hypothetical protein
MVHEVWGMAVLMEFELREFGILGLLCIEKCWKS